MHKNEVCISAALVMDSGTVRKERQIFHVIVWIITLFML